MDRVVSISLGLGFCHSVCLAQKRAQDHGKLSFLGRVDLCGHWEHVFDIPAMAGARGA